MRPRKRDRANMSLSTWFCSSSSKKMLVKIVHPGGHVELHDRSLLASEIMFRNPRCCVAYPHIFRQPWAIVPPDTMLRPGQKFYVVPIGTIRKLQRLSLRNSPSPQQGESSDSPVDSEQEEAAGTVSDCWLACLSAKDYKRSSTSSGSATEGTCFACLLAKGNEGFSSDEAHSSSTSGSSETKELTRKRSKEADVRRGLRSSPRRSTSLESWKPSLARIEEESIALSL